MAGALFSSHTASRVGARSFGQGCRAAACYFVSDGSCSRSAWNKQVLAGCTKQRGSTDCSQGRSRARVSRARAGLWVRQMFTAAPQRMGKDSGAPRQKSARCDQRVLHLPRPRSSLTTCQNNSTWKYCCDLSLLPGRALTVSAQGLFIF